MTRPLHDPNTDPKAHWLTDPVHRAYLREDALRQLAFFAPSLRVDGGFDVLDLGGAPLPRQGQELHTTTRMIHSYALGRSAGFDPAQADRIIDAGLHYLWTNHRDTTHGGYLWGVDGSNITRDTKLAYGHVFVLLAASSALTIGHPDAQRLLDDIAEVIDTHFWEADNARLCDEFTRDWQPFSDYRGMNANMHGVEAFLAAFEATGSRHWLDRAGAILEFFTAQMASTQGWRIPEHYKADWQVDPGYSGDPMFRPAGTTPGHSLEFARLILHHWDLAGRPDTDAPKRARALALTALNDAWLPEGGIAYTLDIQGEISIPDRYWWPVTEAIGALAALWKAHDPSADPEPDIADWYARLWRFAQAHFIDETTGGWFPELAPEGQPTSRQFLGKPDIYHALQADLLPLAPGLSRQLTTLPTSA